jgi:RNA polymerase sigma-70 factor, ECF subfamily
MPGLLPSADCDFGRLFVRYQARIYGYIRSMVVHRTDAEDLLQETASVLWRKFDEFRPGTDFLAWALQVARYQVLYFRQRRKRDVLQFSDRFVEVMISDTVAEAARLGDLQELLDGCLDKLPQTDRDLFELRYQSDLPTRALAEQLGRPSSTVYNALNRIRRAVVQCVEQALRRSGARGAMEEDRADPPRPIDREYYK